MSGTITHLRNTNGQGKVLALREFEVLMKKANLLREHLRMILEAQRVFAYLVFQQITE